MNKAYRSVWNATSGTWVAAAETAKGRSKGSSSKVLRSVVISSAVLGAAVTAPGIAQANTIAMGNCTNGAVQTFNGISYGPTRRPLLTAAGLGRQSLAVPLRAVTFPACRYLALLPRQLAITLPPSALPLQPLLAHPR